MRGEAGRNDASARHVTARESAALWETRLAAEFAPVAFEPLPGTRFVGSAGTVLSGPELTITTATVGGQTTWRTARHVARGESEIITAVITTDGQKVLEYDGGALTLTPGSMVLVDSGVPLRSIVRDTTTSIVVSVPRTVLLARTGLPEDHFRRVLRAPVPVHGAAAAVAAFFRGLSTPEAAPHEVAALSAYGVDLLAAVLTLESDRHPRGGPAATHTRERVLAYLRANFTDAALTAERVALSCNISRSTLYRVLEPDGGVGAVLRRLRVAYACRLLLARPHAAVAAIALDCGFSGERRLYRAFRTEMRATPGEYRAVHLGHRRWTE
ncbi:AraC family transcriptional regulator [Nocardia sp. NPDC003693]